MANSARQRQFDSLAYSNKLRKAGISEEQANIQAEALLGVIEEQFLSRQDLEKVELKLGTDIERLDAKLSGEIKEVRSEIKEVKTDVERVEAKLSAEIKEVRAKLSAEIKDVRRDVKESELRLFVRLIGAMILVGGILKYLPLIHF